MSPEDQELLRQVRLAPHKIGFLMGKTKLTPLHSQWILDVWLAVKNSALQAHRGSFKTTALTEVGPIFWLLFNPDDRLALCRKTATDAQASLSVIRAAFRIPEIRQLFHIAHGCYPDFVVEQADSLTFAFKQTVTKEGNIDAFGIDSAMTGYHYDKILCDDIVGREDRYSPAERVKTRRFYEELTANIIDDGKQVLHVGTPWHKADAWELGPQPMCYDCHTTGILDDEAIEAKRQMMTPSLFAANYLLRHQADDRALFSDPPQEPWQFEPGTVVAHLDAAFGGDCWNGFTVMQRRKDGVLQALGKAYEGHVGKAYHRIVELLRRYSVRKLYMEENADKGFTLKEIIALARESGVQVQGVGYHESEKKDVKIATQLVSWWPKMIWASESDNDYISQVADWQEGAQPNDCPDSAASLLREGFGQANDKLRALWGL